MATRTGTGTRTRIARPVVAVSAVAALACAAACGGGGADQDGKSSRPTASEQRTAGPKEKTPTQDGQDGQNSQDGQENEDSQGSQGGGTSDAQKADERPLTKAQLKKAALVTADVKGFEVKESEGADLLGRSVPAAPSKCQPVADMFLFATDPASEDGVSRGVAAKDETDASVHTFALLSYESGKADEVIDGLRSATKNCTGYRYVGYDYKGVKALADPDLGDESVAYRMVASIEGAQVPVAYTVVRDGTTLVAFSSMNLLDADKIEVPAKLVEAQLAKLTKTTG
ncbi:hypothetical protein QF026_003524 [Streptomyces aurantiacus]|uniref:hypothetical protein n=1 Tax=Streptomyces aurantiacus TaxID=47760 RepID=UPI002793CDC9|nr:hypothetical protein [Streptomyces aurantiacus]MDQ0775058.1 hypothetical protein [Streptomyces aurantiacus]